MRCGPQDSRGCEEVTRIGDAQKEARLLWRSRASEIVVEHVFNVLVTGKLETCPTAFATSFSCRS